MKTLIAVVIGATMALSFSAEAITCADLWEANPQSQSATFIRISKTKPDVAESLKQESIATCEGVAQGAKNGVSVDDALYIAQKHTKNLPEGGKASVIFMVLGGWQLGKGE